MSYVAYIALSDGHGDFGVTPGKRSPKFEDGTLMYENAFNKMVVKYLKEELERNNFKTVLVAPTDADTSLHDRVAKADAEKVDLYLSVHANASGDKWSNARGIETFVFIGSKDSERIGAIIHKNLMKGTKMLDRGVKSGNHLYEIRKPKAPSVLVECGFMTNEEEVKLLMSDLYRRECAKELAMGVCEAYNVKYTEFQPEPAKKPAPAPVKQQTKPKATFNLPNKVIESGKGAEIKEIQKALIAVGEKLPKFGADGDFGDETIKALKSFQAKNKLKADGVYGPNTRTALLKKLN